MNLLLASIAMVVIGLSLTIVAVAIPGNQVLYLSIPGFVLVCVGCATNLYNMVRD